MIRTSGGTAPAPLAAALLLYTAWTAGTYLLEGRILTLLRPDAAGERLAYALVANVLIGIAGAGVLLARAGVVPQRVGLRSTPYTMVAGAAAGALGLAAFLVPRPATLDPAVLANAFAQVWVTSVAEVLVCWAALGTAVETALARHLPSRWATVLAWLLAAGAFGVYHVAHSPPFDTARMVMLLSVVGLVTGAFYFLVRELYGTIVLHTFLAMKGVTAALAAGGRLEGLAVLQPVLMLTALLATGTLMLADRWIRSRTRPTVREG